ncbi:50S ribosomal protein L11 methyltransferase [Aliifodinibius sp. S!AR15-10]|uniref:50S ribosomal protein L11 methyltransferase n=1 Tax=Aliifodinibius sp. S!AR15-10 TaxID=2950437 RepID=UPI00285B0CC9|nr:50S ribosomal protein L11 methyltransferase [Aliifodinibius sp. S!AR15-10]MDR8394648.1 50S ribosomal protein L11 methyltransferase [Aliifodinibius sp. S!AR15-10]
MKYIKLVLSVTNDYQEALIAELLELEFDAFEQQDGKLITYISRERFSDVSRERIEQVLAAYPGEGHIQSEEVVADQNWNQEWERTIKAQRIGQFFVKPTWDNSTAPSNSILLEIDPKMAFGTGYHETTRLMLQLLPHVVKSGDLVMDAGTGTGVLSIAAIKLGAERAVAFDIDDWSIRNAQENVLINQVDRKVEVAKGSIEIVPDETEFDVILANINRNTIIDMLPSLVQHLKSDGMLVLSGLLISDKDTILEQEALKKLTLIQSIRENDWIALQFKIT